MKYNRAIVKSVVSTIIVASLIMGGCGNNSTVAEVIENQDVESTSEAALEGTSEATTEALTGEIEVATEEATTESVEVEETVFNRKRNTEPVKIKGIYVSGPTAGTKRMQDLIQLVEDTELNAMVIDVKNDEGRVTYKMDLDSVNEIDASIAYIRDIDSLIKTCKEKNIYLIARIVAFKDPYLAENKPEYAINQKSGGIFKDKKGLAWVNPYKREVWDYLVDLGIQAAHDGFDEIQFDYIRFCTEIKESDIDYGEESQTVSKMEIISEFTEYAYDKLSAEGVYVAADVYGTIIDSEVDQRIVGQDYVDMSTKLDYICPMLYPSHYANGVYGMKVPDAEPRRTIRSAMNAANKELSVLEEGQHRAIARVWLQAFTAGWVNGHITYGKQQIRDQIHGAYEAGYDEWILWNAGVKYPRELFLTEEESVKEKEKWDANKEEPTAAPSPTKQPEAVTPVQEVTQENQVPSVPGNAEVAPDVIPTEEPLPDAIIPEQPELPVVESNSNNI